MDPRKMFEHISLQRIFLDNILVERIIFLKYLFI